MKTDKKTAFGEAMDWIGSPPFHTVGISSRDFELVLELWRGVRDLGERPEAMVIEPMIVKAVQRVELLGEPVLAVLFYTGEEWDRGLEPRSKYLFFLVGGEFLRQLELAKEWGLEE